MQSLELSCQESDFKLNDALSKIKGHHTSSVTETTTTLTTRLPTNTQHQNRNQSFNSIHNVQNVQNCSSIESNSTMTTHSTSAATVTSHSRNNNTSTDRLSTSKQSSPSTASSSTHDGGGSGNDGANATITSEKQTPSNSSMSGSTSDSSFFDIHEKLRELYVYLYLKDIQDTQVDNRIKLKSRSFVLETLVARENLNTVILNLYPGNKGYSLAFRQEYLPQNKKYDGLHSIFNRSLTKSQLCGATEVNNVNCVRQEKEEHLLETVRWPYENGDLLESVNNEELPILYMKLLLSYAPNAFYSGCVIVEVRDYRQSFPISACCDNYYVLLKPTTQTLLADVKVLSNEEDFTHEDRVALESNMVLATAAPLCLDPSPKVARKAFYSQHKRQMWNTFAIRRQMRKFSQVAINRKRKTDQFTHTQGLDLSDYLFRARQRPRHLLSNSFESSIGTQWKIPRKASDVMKPIRTPNLDLPNTLKPPSSVNVEQLARAYERPRETKDCMPILIEEYILETDRGGGRVYHIKLSIYQRPTNSEYLGELYVDRDYQKNSRNGEACQFSLGTRAHANRYIQQFTEIFTEEGRKSVKITHIVPGHAPKVSYTTGMVESLPLPTQPKGQQPQSQPPQQQQQQQPINPGTSQGQTQVASSQSQLNNQQKVAITLKSPTSAHSVHASPVASDVPGPSQNQPTHLKIANGSVVVVQEQSSGNISRVATITSQQAQNQGSSNAQPGIVTNNLPLLAQISAKPATQTITTASGSSNEINTLMTSIIQSPTHQAGAAQGLKSNNNAAIISLLNSAPAAMTSSAVVNSLNTPSNSPVTIPIQRLIATHTPNNVTDNLQQQSQQIIRERLPDYPLRNGLIWNNAPGALLTLPTFADSSLKMPFLLDILNREPGHNFTAVIFVEIGVTLTPSSALYRLVKTITRSQYVARIIILWASDRPIPSRKRWPNTGAIPFHIISSIVNDERPTISQRFYPHKFIDTDAILSLDEDAILNTDELDFAYQVWRDFPDRIVGYPARAHFWDDSKNAWGYTSKWTNYYSIVLTGAAFYHQYYNYVYTNWLPLLLLKTVQQSSNCEDILMNFLISHVTRKAPIKVTQRKGYKDRESGRSPWNDPDHFIQRQSCLNTFAAVFGYMPLLRSNLRLDPVLYRDSVSNLRKKYRQIELVGS